MRFDHYGFSWKDDGHITIALYHKGKILMEFTVDDVNCDNFIKNLVKSREDAKRAKRK
ncbi:hypothetical protein SEA_ENYGMA_253 [Streptomyces phage Enygma]